MRTLSKYISIIIFSCNIILLQQYQEVCGTPEPTEDEIFDFEEYVDVGDIVVFYPSLRHGVAEIDPGESVNWKNRDGRWYMALFSPDTDHVKERATSRHLG